MSPEAKSSAAGLARLLAEIGEDRAGMAERQADAREAERRLATTPEDPGALALAAVALHGWYTGLEAILERIAREVDGTVPTGDRWHRELLSQASAEIPGARPRVLERELLPDLAALLAFRHFFRHAYAAKLDATHLGPELARLLRVAEPVGRALDVFAEFVTAVLAKLAQA